MLNWEKLVCIRLGEGCLLVCVCPGLHCTITIIAFDKGRTTAIL